MRRHSQLSTEVSRWLVATAAALARIRPSLGGGCDQREQSATQSLRELGEAASSLSRDRLPASVILRHGRAAHGRGPRPCWTTRSPRSITVLARNRRDDGLYHAYNLLGVGADAHHDRYLYPMLEGQVAALSAGAIAPDEAVAVLEALFDSDVYRPDQNSFMLYPDRALPGFLDKNRIPAEQVEAIPLLQQMLAAGDERIVVRDADGCYRFNADFSNCRDLRKRLDALAADYAAALNRSREPLLKLYEQVFHHKAFTGRSGTCSASRGSAPSTGTWCRSCCWRCRRTSLRRRTGARCAATTAAARRTVLSRPRRHRLQQDAGRIRRISDRPLLAHAQTRRRATAGHDRPGQGRSADPFRRARRSRRDGAGSFSAALLRAREFVAAAREFRFLDVDGNWQTICRSRPWPGIHLVPGPDRLRADDNADAPASRCSRDDGTVLEMQSSHCRAPKALSCFHAAAAYSELT